ncbi:glycoside hydrolase family 16 protein [Bisporella sp. PMI_857]|nr:glycoside hydrolase family 16 protein [Bisporella sp. PMI_857]
MAEIPNKGGHRVIWSDDFNGPSGKVDTSQWNYETQPGGNSNNEIQVYQESAQYAGQNGEGSLYISVRKSMAGNWFSARIATWPTFTCAKGHKMTIEAEIKLGDAPADRQQGIWPAFWALGSAIYKGTPWPGCGEWDIMEVKNGEDRSLASLHYGADKGSKDGITFDRSQFHKWSIEIDRTSDNWQEQAINWYLDGNRYQTVTGSDVGNFDSWVTLAHSPYYVLLNIAVGGDYPGMPNDNTKSGGDVGMLVNYVAVYGTDGA